MIKGSDNVHDALEKVAQAMFSPELIVLRAKHAKRILQQSNPTASGSQASHKQYGASGKKVVMPVGNFWK